MKSQYISDNWKVIERGFDPAIVQGSESLFSLGNSHMGHRGNFEEGYSGQSLQGSYVAGVYYPDKTRVGWWKNGYPEYFAKVLNSVNWIGIRVFIEEQELDIANCKVHDFERVLDMKTGTLERNCDLEMGDGKRLKLSSIRFCSMNDPELGFIEYKIQPINFSAKVRFEPILDFDVHNQDSNYGEYFWEGNETGIPEEVCYNLARTKKTGFTVAAGMAVSPIGSASSTSDIKEQYQVGWKMEFQVAQDQVVGIQKYSSILSSFDHDPKVIAQAAMEKASSAKKNGFEKEFEAHKQSWEGIWKDSDIKINGDIEAQQGIRFNIFHLFQTYKGDDPRMNIGPKGFTGEKYGGSTYWDTEAYCIPFYLGNSDPSVSRQLLVYRYQHLQKAIENAEKLGFKEGAALYPMVTMNGEECHNEWEITFEEIHRNGAIAYAIHRYMEYTGDREYLAQHGLEVVVGIARFWMQRMNYSEQKKKWVILGVTGPNEYENNVNNNWYTNFLATWCLGFAIKCWDHVKTHHADRHKELESILSLERKEVDSWAERMANVYLPRDKTRNVFLQQDNFLDKEIKGANEIPEGERPINQHWSWDRILRSCFIKQADVLQGMYFFYDDFGRDELERNFDFYEPMTVHESSLSPCVHSVLASRLKRSKKAYELYLRTARLDLDDYNKEVHEGLHITSMAGTWISVVEGFGGYHVSEGKVHFDPILPEQWENLEFKLRFRGNMIRVSITQNMINLELIAGKSISIVVSGNDHNLSTSSSLEIPINP